MKKLSLLIFAILILACGTEKPVVEEPEPIAEEPPSVVMEPEPIGHPLIAGGTVKNGELNVDPELLNREGLEFEFTEDISDYHADEVYLLERDGPNLPWEVIFTVWNPFFIPPLSEFKYDTEYQVLISLYDPDCEYTQIVIQFRTKPQRPVVGRPDPVIQEQVLTVPSGPHFPFDITDTHIIDGDVPPFHRGRDIDPEPLNANGIQFEFNLPIRKYEIDLRVKDGATLGWLPRGLVDNDMGERIQITPAEGFPLLDFDTEYVINIFVLDSRCMHWRFDIQFRTKQKP